MFTKRLAFIGTLLALLSGGPLASTALATDDVAFDLNVAGVIFAEEILGTRPADRALGADVADPGLTATLTVRAGTGVAEASGGGAAGEITFRLTGGAQFGANLAVGSLDFVDMPNEGANPSIEIASGGAKGDSEVVFAITAGGVGSTSNLVLDEGDQLVLTIPSLQNLGNLQAPADADSDGDTIKVEVATRALTSSTATGGFRTVDPLVDGADDTITEDDLVTVVDVFTLSTQTGTTAQINLADRDTLQMGATSVEVDNADLQAITIGTLRINVDASTAAEPETERPKESDGLTDFDALASDDELVITVAGDFQTDAQVFIDLDGDRDLDRGEAISLTEGLTLTSDDAEAVVGADRHIYYVLDGTTELTPGSFTISALLDYSNDFYRDEPRQTSAPTEAEFAGIMEDGFAYAIPNCTADEDVRIRVTNEASSAQSLFVSGTDQAGEDLGFMEVDADMIRVSGAGGRSMLPGETLVMTTGHLEQVFGFTDGTTACSAANTWTGRLRVSFFTSSNITVMPQVLGADGEIRDLGGFTGLTAGADAIKR